MPCVTNSTPSAPASGSGASEPPPGRHLQDVVREGLREPRQGPRDHPERASPSQPGRNEVTMSVMQPRGITA